MFDLWMFNKNLNVLKKIRLFITSLFAWQISVMFMSPFISSRSMILSPRVKGVRLMYEFLRIKTEVCNTKIFLHFTKIKASVCCNLPAKSLNNANTWKSLRLEVTTELFPSASSRSGIELVDSRTCNLQ